MGASTAANSDQFFDTSLDIDPKTICDQSMYNVVPKSGAFSYSIIDGEVFYKQERFSQERFATKVPSINPNEDVLLIGDTNFLEKFSDQERKAFLSELLATANNFCTEGRNMNFWFYVEDNADLRDQLYQLGFSPRKLGGDNVSPHFLSLN